MNEELRREDSASSSVPKGQPHEWELMKENTAPLARGRSIPPHGTTIVDANELQRTIDHFEAQIALPSKEDDPLVIWLLYIKFLQESVHPSKTHQASPVFSLLERCIQTFCTHSRYANDPRFIRICCLYADQTKEPLTTFQQMHQPPYRIGTESAVFFNAWAFVAEKMQLYTVAEQIFRQGLSTNVQPITYLQTRHARFQKRMSRHWLNASLQGGGDEEASSSAQLPQRTIFGSLSSSTTHRSSALSAQPLIRTNATTHRSRFNQPQIPPTVPFVIASDDVEQTFLPHDDKATHFTASWKPEAERWKENRGPLQQWNAFGALTSAYDQEHPSSSLAMTTTASTNRPSLSATTSATAVGFSIHVDEDCVPPPSTQHEHRHRAARDDRVQTKSTNEDAKQSKPSKPMWKHRLLSHPVTKEEQSFEQARYQANAFTLLSPSHNINLLRRSNVEDEELDRDMSMSMEELMSEHEASFTTTTTDPQRFMNSSTASTPIPNSLGSYPRPPTSINRILPNNEPTINTQWALRELSVMFASPAAAPTATFEDTNHTTANPEEKCNENPEFAIFCDLGEDDERKASSINVGNHPEPSYAIFSDDTGEAQPKDVVSPPLDRPSDGISPSAVLSVGDTATFTLSVPSLFPQSSNKTNPLVKDLPRTAESKATSNGIGSAGLSSFAIFCDPETQPKNAILPMHPRPVPSHPLPHQYPEDSPSSTAGLSVGDTATFTLSVPSLFPPSRTIDHVSTEMLKNEPSTKPIGNKTVGVSSFEIFCDPKTEHNDEKVPPLHPKSSTHPLSHHQHMDSPSSAAGLSVGDTAAFTLSIPSSIRASHSPRAMPAPSISDPCVSDGDTVTFSELSDELQRVAVDRRRKSVNRLPPSFFSEQSLPKHDMAEAANRDGGTPRSDITGPPSPTCFGDISIIVPNGTDETMHFLPKGIDYLELIQRNIQLAQEKIQTSVAAHEFPRRKPLSQVLSTSGIYRLPTHVLPRPLKQGNVEQGTTLALDTCTGVVDRVVSRQAHDLTLVLKDESNPVVIKAQFPTGSLTWEYEILQRIEQRIQTSLLRVGFPTVKAFVALADGAIFSMHIESRSGMNLIDLNKMYTEAGEEIPEIVALHYAARMLQTLESLHWHAKVLHCDAKPENWIITSKASKSDRLSSAVSDLVLVNFERSIDLQDTTENREFPDDDCVDALFIGNTSRAPDMQCLAMRLGLPWSFDIDTFGVCTSLHFLLFGTLIELESYQSPNGCQRWLPKEQFPRHFEKKLWIEIFDTLLNLDEDFGRAIGSRPYSVKQLRQHIEDYLVSDGNDIRLQASWNRQASLMSDYNSSDARVGRS